MLLMLTLIMIAMKNKNNLKIKEKRKQLGWVGPVIEYGDKALLEISGLFVNTNYKLKSQWTLNVYHALQDGILLKYTIL